MSDLNDLNDICPSLKLCLPQFIQTLQLPNPAPVFAVLIAACDVAEQPLRAAIYLLIHYF